MIARFWSAVRLASLVVGIVLCCTACGSAGDSPASVRGAGEVATGSSLDKGLLAQEESAEPTPTVTGEEAQSGPTAREIMDEVSRRHDSDYEFEEQEMRLGSGNNLRNKRRLRLYSRRDSETERKFLVVFLEPRAVEGVALLTWWHKRGEPDQWTYLPAYGKQMKRIAKGGRRGYFMGTDFTYEDLSPVDTDKYRLVRLPDDVIDGAAHFVIQAYPEDPEERQESGYQYRQYWISQDLYLVMRADFYDLRGRFQKRQTFGDFVNAKGEMWRANEIRMDNEAEDHVTAIRVLERNLSESAVPEQNFQHRFVTSGKHIR